MGELQLDIVFALCCDRPLDLCDCNKTTWELCPWCEGRGCIEFPINEDTVDLYDCSPCNGLGEIEVQTE